MAKKRKKTGKKKARKKISARRRKLINRKISATKLRNNSRNQLERLMDSKNPLHYIDEIKRLEKEIEIRTSIISNANYKLNFIPKSQRELRKFEPTEGELLEENLGHYWDRKDIEERINSNDIQTINGINKKENFDDVIDLLNVLMGKTKGGGEMGSNDVLILQRNDNGTHNLYIQNKNDLPDYLNE
jgi:hypothetical protein